MKIYYAKINEFSEEEVKQALALLPKERVERLEKIKLNKVRLQSMAAGVLLEYALQEHGLEGKHLCFKKNADGKPFIAEYPHFYYNLSHSNEYVALVVDENPVGIDVESLRVGYQKLVARFFSEEEEQFLLEKWSDELFTKLWTRKESYLKATGIGMRMPLNGFSTLENQVQINEKMCSEMIEPDTCYYLMSMVLEKEYWLSVCRKGVPVIAGDNMGLPLQQVDLKEVIKR